MLIKLIQAMKGGISMSGKKLLKYLLYIIILIGYLYVSTLILGLFKNASAATVNVILFYTVYYVLFIIFGLLLGLEHLISECMKGGRWTVNAEKAIFLGLLPLLLYVFCLLFYGQVIHLSANMNLVILGPSFQSYIAIILGYALATIFVKSQDVG
jgi:hypothetical protein